MLRQKNDIYAAFASFLHLLAFYSILKIFIFKVESLFKVKPKSFKKDVHYVDNFIFFDPP